MARPAGQARAGAFALLALAALAVLHNDFWLWNDPRLVLGLPVGLAWHVGYCVVAAGLFGWLVRKPR